MVKAPPEVLPRSEEVVTCRYCKAKIFYARTKNGADMPFDVKPAKPWRVYRNTEGEALRCAYVEETLYIPHWARCSGSAQARRGREGP